MRFGEFWGRIQSGCDGGSRGEASKVRIRDHVHPGADRFLARYRDWWQRRNEPSRCGHCGALRSGLVVQVDLEVSINTKPIADIASTADPRCMVGAVRTRPPHTHRHGGDGCRCRWCGSKAGGIDCPYYPTGVHEHSPSSEKRPRGRAMNRRVGPGLRHVAKCGRHPPSQPAPPCVRTAPWHGRKPPTLSASFRGAFLTIRLKRSCNSWAHTYEI